VNAIWVAFFRDYTGPYQGCGRLSKRLLVQMTAYLAPTEEANGDLRTVFKAFVRDSVLVAEDRLLCGQLLAEATL
jgi:hypothetical protein